MEQAELVSLIRKLRDMDITKSFEDKIAALEAQGESADEKGRDLLRDEFERLAKEIGSETGLQKENF